MNKNVCFISIGIGSFYADSLWSPFLDFLYHKTTGVVHDGGIEEVQAIRPVEKLAASELEDGLPAHAISNNLAGFELQMRRHVSGGGISDSRNHRLFQIYAYAAIEIGVITEIHISDACLETDSAAVVPSLCLFREGQSEYIGVMHARMVGGGATLKAELLHCAFSSRIRYLKSYMWPLAPPRL